MAHTRPDNTEESHRDTKRRCTRNVESDARLQYALLPLDIQYMITRVLVQCSPRTALSMAATCTAQTALLERSRDVLACNSSFVAREPASVKASDYVRLYAALNITDERSARTTVALFLLESLGDCAYHGVNGVWTLRKPWDDTAVLFRWARREPALSTNKARLKAWYEWLTSFPRDTQTEGGAPLQMDALFNRPYPAFKQRRPYVWHDTERLIKHGIKIGEGTGAPTVPPNLWPFAVFDPERSFMGESAFEKLITRDQLIEWNKRGTLDRDSAMARTLGSIEARDALARYIDHWLMLGSKERFGPCLANDAPLTLPRFTVLFDVHMYMVAIREGILLLIDIVSDAVEALLDETAVAQ